MVKNSFQRAKRVLGNTLLRPGSYRFDYFPYQENRTTVPFFFFFMGDVDVLCVCGTGWVAQ